MYEAMPSVDEVVAEIHALDRTQLGRVLDFIHDIKRPKGTLGKHAVEYAHRLRMPATDLQDIAQAVTELDEQIDHFPQVNLDG